jgi:uncharacterized membrane protein HdeD (DUF308 family)
MFGLRRRFSDEGPMKIAFNTVGVLLVVSGSVWFLQGINVLPGSFMTGQIRWAVYGSIAVIVGVILLVIAARKRGSKPL